MAFPPLLERLNILAAGHPELDDDRRFALADATIDGAVDIRVGKLWAFGVLPSLLAS
jgi:hypothetical protein